MAHEQPSGPPLEHIRLTEVARRAGVSVGALYHYWDTQDDYRDDLLDHVFAPDRFEPEVDVRALADAVASDDPAALPPLDEAIRAGTGAEFEHLRTSPDLRVLLAMWAADDATINQRIEHHYRSVGEGWADFYEATLGAYGLEVRPPFTYRSMAAVLAAIGDGLAVRASVDASVSMDLVEPGPDGDREWTLLGCALIALLPMFSRPAGDDQDFWSLLERLRQDLGAG